MIIRHGLCIGKFSWTWKYMIFFCLLLSTFLTIVGFVYVERQTREKTRLIMDAMGNRVTAEFVQPTLDTSIIEPDENSRIYCNKSYLVIMITSLAKNFARRKAIRNTWAKWQKEYNAVIYFFTGTGQITDLENLLAEADEYGDLIVDDMEENKYHLTVKTLRMLKFFINNCPNGNFLVRADDDIFLNVPVLVKHLEDLNSTVLSSYIGGLVHEGRRPHDKNPFSKWYVPRLLWENGTIYPPYIDSLCTIFSGKIVPNIFEASLATPLFHISEVFLTGIVASLNLNMELSNIPQIYDGQFWPKVNYFFKSTEFLQTHVIAYHCSDDFRLMRKLFLNSWARYNQVQDVSAGGGGGGDEIDNNNNNNNNAIDSI